MSKKKPAKAPEAGVEQTRIVKAGRPAAKGLNKPNEPKGQPAPKEEPQAPAMHRVTVHLSESDLKALRDSKGEATSVTAFGTKSMTDHQKEYRKAYGARPDVKEKMKAYRAKRAAAKRAADVKTVIAQADDQAKRRRRSR
jgi:hypothetical protein